MHAKVVTRSLKQVNKIATDIANVSMAKEPCLADLTKSTNSTLVKHGCLSNRIASETTSTKQGQ